MMINLKLNFSHSKLSLSASIFEIESSEKSEFEISSILLLINDIFDFAFKISVSYSEIDLSISALSFAISVTENMPCFTTSSKLATFWRSC